MTHYSILLTVHTPWIYCRKLCSRKCYTRLHIFSQADIFPTHFLIPLTDCWTHQKLSWNLITPLTFMFQPQFFFRRTILAPEAGEDRTMQVFQTRQLILPHLIIITDEFNSLRKQNESESRSPHTEEQT